MSFFKIINGELVEAPNFVHTPTTSLLAADHLSYTYPIDDWYWFDTKAEAITSLGYVETKVDPTITLTQTDLTEIENRNKIEPVSKTQFIQVLEEQGLLSEVESAIAQSSNKELQYAYIHSDIFERNHSFIIALSIILDKTPKEVDDLFILAATK